MHTIAFPWNQQSNINLPSKYINLPSPEWFTKCILKKNKLNSLPGHWKIVAGGISLESKYGFSQNTKELSPTASIIAATRCLSSPAQAAWQRLEPHKEKWIPPSLLCLPPHTSWMLGPCSPKQTWLIIRIWGSWHVGVILHPTFCTWQGLRRTSPAPCCAQNWFESQQEKQSWKPLEVRQHTLQTHTPHTLGVAGNRQEWVAGLASWAEIGTGDFTGASNERSTYKYS